jgi:hypothetical protein
LTLAIVAFHPGIAFFQKRAAAWLDEPKPVSWNKPGLPIPAARPVGQALVTVGLGRNVEAALGNRLARSARDRPTLRADDRLVSRTIERITIDGVYRCEGFDTYCKWSQVTVKDWTFLVPVRGLAKGWCVKFEGIGA